MARGKLNLSELVRDGSVIPTSNTVDSAVVSAGSYYIPEKDENIVLMVSNTTEAEKDITVKAGVFFRADLGDLVVPVAASGSVAIGPLESARFKQADGSVYLDFETGFEGSIEVLKS